MGFQPGIAIFADHAGQAVYRHFLSLTQHIHTRIRHGMGLIVLADEEKRLYTSRLLSEIITGDRDRQEQALNDASDDLVSALIGLRARLESEAEEEFYKKGRTLMQPFQVYIVGDTSAQTRALASQMRARQTRTDEIEISYLFCCTPPPAEEELFAGSDELATWAAENEIRFSYLYGDVTREIQQEYSAENFAYAAALALFTLLTTDLSVQMREKQEGDESAQQRPCCGTLSACLISSPHEQIRQAYAAKVGELLLKSWQTDVIQSRNRQDTGDPVIEAMKRTPTSWLPFSIEEPGKDKASRKPEQTEASIRRVPPRQLVLEPSNAYLDKETRPDYEVLYKSFEKQTKNLLQLDMSPGSLTPTRWLAGMRQHRAPDEQPEGDWETWRQAFASLWEYLKQKTCTKVHQAVEGLWEKTGLSGVITYATMLDRQLQSIEGRLRPALADLERSLAPDQSESPRPSEIEASAQESDESWRREALKADHLDPGPETSNAQASVETPEQELARWRSAQPDRLLLSLVSLLAGLLLFLAVWMLLSEFGGSQLQFLVPIALLCFGGTFGAEHLYLRHTYGAPLEQARQKVQAVAREKWLNRCLAESYTQRLELVRQFREYIQCLTEAFLKETTSSLDKQARDALGQPFSQSTGGRNFLCGKGRSLANAEQARAEFLNPERQVNILHKNLSPDFTNSCKTLFYQNFPRSGQQDGERSLQDSLYYEIRSEIDLWFRLEQENDAQLPGIERKNRSRTTYISSADFALYTKPEFLRQVLQRAQLPALWQTRAEDSTTSYFCAAPTAQKLREDADLPGPPVAIETIQAREKGTSFGLTTNWMLLAVCHSRPLFYTESG